MEGDQTSVEKLAQAPCPDCKCDCNNISDQAECQATYCTEQCPTCGGTGVLVPSLRLKCSGVTSGYTGDFRTRLVVHDDSVPGYKCRCQDTGWVLIPAAEQLEPLMIELLGCVGEVVIGKTGKGNRFAQDHTGYYLVIDGVPTAIVAWEKLTEMVAAAICQALGVTTKMQGE